MSLGCTFADGGVRCVSDKQREAILLITALSLACQAQTKARPFVYITAAGTESCVIGLIHFLVALHKK